MKRAVVFSVVAIFLLTIGLIVTFVVDHGSKDGNGKQFLVGVTYCGTTPEEAKVLIDRVKNYTNLFVLQSGPLMRDNASLVEIGDYAISAGLHFAAFFESGNLFPLKEARWLEGAEERWGGMFAGVYFGDEPGGKMLDATVILSESPAGNSSVTVNVFGNSSDAISNATVISPDVTTSSPNIIKLAGGGIFTGGTTYLPNGTIMVNGSITYYPNGSITIQEGGDFFTMENGTDLISQVGSYEEVLSRHPIPNCDAAAENFVSRNQKNLDDLSSQWQLSNRSFPIFTSDYALYWWDYQSGYDMVLAELGWNNTVAQEIGLVRGAANLQDKQWGTIITWTYTKPPYLVSGDEIYDQMRTSYESGAEYVIIFNYAQDMKGPYGTLQNEHFDALERFWNDVVQNPAVVHGGIKAETAFVLPNNYGWGLRNPNDTVWGLWTPNAEAQQALPLLQDALAKHGLRLDIVYDDPAYPVAGRYPQVYYWNQTS